MGDGGFDFSFFGDGGDGGVQGPIPGGGDGLGGGGGSTGDGGIGVGDGTGGGGGLGDGNTFIGDGAGLPTGGGTGGFGDGGFGGGGGGGAFGDGGFGEGDVGSTFGSSDITDPANWGTGLDAATTGDVSPDLSGVSPFDPAVMAQTMNPAGPAASTTPIGQGAEGGAGGNTADQFTIPDISSDPTIAQYANNPNYPGNQTAQGGGGPGGGQGGGGGAQQMFNTMARGMSQALNQGYQPSPYRYPYRNPYLNPYGNPNNPFASGTSGGNVRRLADMLAFGRGDPFRLANAGMITPEQANLLSRTYSGLVARYARQLGVSPQQLSPGIRELIANNAISSIGLEGA